jgi:signal transduction histidine kinase
VLAISFVRLLVPSSLKTHLFAPLYASLAVLVLLILGQQGLNLWIAFHSQQAADLVTHTLIVEREGERLLNAVIDEERNFLETRSYGEFDFYSSLNRLYTLVQDNPTQLQQLDKIKNVHAQWQSQLGKREIFRLTSSRHSLAEKTLFNSLRSQIRILLEREEILLGERKYQLQQLYDVNAAVNIFSTMVILVGVGWNLRLLYQRVGVPLHKLMEVGEAWRTGQMEVRLGYSSADEIGRLARVLDAMAGEAHYRQECIEVRNQQLENLISALSHDLRTPLLATRNTLDGMLKGAFGPVSDNWREVFDEYRQANEDLLKLVEALLNISRYQAGYGTHLNCEPLNWERIFVKVITRLKATSKHEFALAYQISPSLPIVYGDELEIQRVVQNLLDNAIRVSEPNKEIFLKVAIVGGTQVQVSVSDQGSGIAPQEKEQLFHRFVQGRGRRGRCGLGLYLCRQIINAHGGTIGVESTLGEGSTFWFTLPISTDKPEFEHE